MSSEFANVKCKFLPIKNCTVGRLQFHILIKLRAGGGALSLDICKNPVFNIWSKFYQRVKSKKKKLKCPCSIFLAGIELRKYSLLFSHPCFKSDIYAYSFLELGHFFGSKHLILKSTLSASIHYRLGICSWTVLFLFLPLSKYLISQLAFPKFEEQLTRTDRNIDKQTDICLIKDYPCIKYRK